jgi:carboxypeptidase family protein/TonB-dependent receptor-like protein
MAHASNVARTVNASRRIQWTAALVAVHLVMATPLHAQMVRGQVVDSVTGVPVGGGSVILLAASTGEAARTVTDPEGLFLLHAGAPGQYRLRVEAAGYRVSEFPPFDLAADPVRSYVLLVAPAVTELPPVTVEAPAPERRRDLREFFKRRETTTGSFLTREEFERMGNVQRVTDVLRRMRGVYIRPGHGWLEWLITTRRGMSRGNMGGECFPLVFMDGSYVGTTANLNVDQLIPANNLEAIEVHASASSLPPEFNRRGATCGVIVFWTR